jgi:hypothetical protein
MSTTTEPCMSCESCELCDFIDLCTYHTPHSKILTENVIQKLKKTKEWFRLRNYIGTPEQYKKIMQMYPRAYEYMLDYIKILPEFYLQAVKEDYYIHVYVPKECMQDPKLQEIMRNHSQNPVNVAKSFGHIYQVSQDISKDFYPYISCAVDEIHEAVRKLKCTCNTDKTGTCHFTPSEMEHDRVIDNAISIICNINMKLAALNNN